MLKKLPSVIALGLVAVIAACGNAVDTRPLSKEGKPRVYDVSVFSNSHFANYESQQGESWFDGVYAFAERCTLPAFGDGARLIALKSADGVDYIFLRAGASADNDALTKEDIVFRLILGVNRRSKYVADLGVLGAPGTVEAELLGRMISGMFARNRPLQPFGDCPNQT